jgi:hypothetical protein
MIDFNMTSFARFRRWVRSGCVGACLWACLLASALTPAVALAQEEEVPRDARLEGYPTKVHLENDSPALSYIFLIFLGALALGVMFKNARRTHLD